MDWIQTSASTRREIFRLCDAEHRCVAVDLPHEAAQHGSRTYLNIRCDALRRKAPYDRLPADRRRDLRDQRLDRVGGAALRFRVDVRHDRDVRIARRQRAQFRRQPRLRRSHQPAVERRAHCERNHTLRTERLRALPGARHGCCRAGDHHLSAAVQIRGAHDVAFRRLFARPHDRLGVQTENRRHRALADRHRLLHVATAAADDCQRVGERERPGGHVRRILAEAVPRHEGGRESARREQPVGRDAHGENRRLRVLRQRELRLGALEADAAERLAERGIGFGKRLAADRERVGERAAHPDFLRSLSRKERGDHCGDTAAAAISCSTRSMNRLEAKRYAIATALRTAFGLERPWPTIARPLTPRSGAPPYSE